MSTVVGFSDSVAPFDQSLLICTSCSRPFGEPSSGLREQSACPFCHKPVVRSVRLTVAELFGLLREGAVA
ncbi:MAG: hypothetical protein HY340_03225 [Candidatus Kerfeldbacteria bacterium]|nr:hypothetical protein [Candidatus Kerfeldbacteria bacterium]